MNNFSEIIIKLNKLRNDPNEVFNFFLDCLESSKYPLMIKYNDLQKSHLEWNNTIEKYIKKLNTLKI